MPHQPAQLPFIDGFMFASAGATQQGVLPLKGFLRLRDLLASDAGEVAYKLEGLRDARGRPSLRVSVSSRLQLRCQRCLEAMEYEVGEQDLLVLAATQAEIDADPVDPEAPDRLLANKDLAVRDLVEDQLILALPYAPRHEGCEAAPGTGKDEKLSPFAGLRGLIGGKRH